jgi:hypothetical protein
MKTRKRRRWGAVIFGGGRRRGGSIVSEVDDTMKSDATADHLRPPIMVSVILSPATFDPTTVSRPCACVFLLCDGVFR